MADPYDPAALRAKWNSLALAERGAAARPADLPSHAPPPGNGKRQVVAHQKWVKKQGVREARFAPELLAAAGAVRDGRAWRRGSNKAAKDAADITCARRMHELMARGKARSIPHAAMIAAVTFAISGPTFDSVWRRLAKAYRRAKPLLISMNCTNRRQI
jgi:hypothetical protein